MTSPNTLHADAHDLTRATAHVRSAFAAIEVLSRFVKTRRADDALSDAIDALDGLAGRLEAAAEAVRDDVVEGV